MLGLANYAWTVIQVYKSPINTTWIQLRVCYSMGDRLAISQSLAASTCSPSATTVGEGTHHYVVQGCIKVRLMFKLSITMALVYSTSLEGPSKNL